MILDETKLASTVLDGEEEEKTEESTPSTEETTASVTLLDGEEEGNSTDAPKEGGSDGDTPSESSDDSSESPKEGGEAN